MGAKYLAWFDFSLLIVPIVLGALSYKDNNIFGVVINIGVFVFLLFKGFSNLNLAATLNKKGDDE